MTILRSRRRLAVLTAAGLVAAGLAVGAAPATAAPSPGGAGLDKHDRQLLAQAQADGQGRVTLLVASRPGANRTVVSGLTALGATVSKRDDDVSYLRVRVPVDRAEQAARVSGVQAADLDEVLPLDDPAPAAAAPVVAQRPPDASTPAVNPYLPIGDTGAAQFVDAHPTWDGRGTTIGILDTGVDLHHPALSRTTTGERKITDWVTATDPATDDDPTWVSMTAQVSGASFIYQGTRYTAPAAGTYRIGRFDERDPRLGGELGRDVDRDGNPAGSSGLFGVLWDTTSNDVYVDTDRDASFVDERAMTDYAVRQDVGTFGTDDPATAVREAMPFVVQTDGRNKFVNIGIVSGAHGTHVAGITAAHGMFGGEMGGAAPGAKLTSVRVCLFVSGCTAHALIEGMISVAKQGNVDVINMSIGGLPSLNDANNARALLYDRLIERYNVQMFISAGNSGAGMNTVGDPSVATRVISVGSSVTRETWQSNYGSDSTQPIGLHGFSSRGPREDGGFKPQVVAPGAAVSTTPTWQPGSPVPGTYALPPGYGMFNGTSMAAPQAAGAAALLVSAGKQTGVQHQPAQLRQALTSSARFLPGYGAYEQGNGLLQVSKAWEVLAQTVKPVAITTSVEVHTALADFLATRGRGVGIHDREGVAVGDPAYERVYTLTRTTGGARAVEYTVSWVGNDGTFASASTVSLPLDRPVTFRVDITPSAVGAHSAIMRLDDLETPGVDAATLNTVVVADRFDAGNGHSVTRAGEVGRNQSVSHFFDVPAGTPAFSVELADASGGTDFGAGEGQLRFLRFHPYGVGVDSNASTGCYNPPAGPCSTGSPTSRTVRDPQPGVWEVVVEGRRTSDAGTAGYRLTAAVLGASVSPDPDVIAAATAGVPVSRTYTVTNRFGAFTGRAVGSTLGSAHRATPTIAHLAQQQRPIQVSAGAKDLRVTIGGPSDPAADLDLFLFDCTTGACVLAELSADGDSEESVTVADPRPGTWVVLVDGYAVPSGSTTYDYVDVFTDPAFGTVQVTDGSALRPAGASWTVPGTVTANASPAAGRVLLGAVLVQAGEIQVGQGTVVVQSVTPGS